MEHKGNGVYEASDIEAKAGDNYRYVIVDKNNSINLVKDPYAKTQHNINGWSSIYDADNYEWKNTDWIEGKDPRRIVRKPKERLRGLDKLIIDEINIPTISEEGTFEGAKKYLDIIADRKIANAIEIMPVENTFSKQWGYDGVDKFAVNEQLGGAKGLKEFVDYAHGKGLNVIMDMVPNHMGPDGDYLPQTGPYEKCPGDFGAKLNYEGNDNKYVRDWMTNAALWWANEFKVDGLRFDMTKQTDSDYFLKQLVDELNEHNPLVFTIAEDGRNNKLSVTRYDDSENDHEDKLDFIDMNVDFINTRNWKSTPHAIGFDSEWDFPLMHSIKSAIISNNQTSLNQIDQLINASEYRVKYTLSHDEIGNLDGTRLIPKIIAQNLKLFYNIDGMNNADRGQKAAQLAQKLVEVVTTKTPLSNTELAKIQSDYGCRNFYNKKQISTALKLALAKARLSQATIMTLPGPKMFFQGEESAETAHFKFFREFSNEKSDRAKDSSISSRIKNEKGYDTNLEEAMSDSVINKLEPVGDFKDMKSNMIKHNQDLMEIFNEHPAMQQGVIVNRYCDYDNLIHIHGLKADDEELLIIKNYADIFHDANYSYSGFPSDGTWVEIFNSDNVEYGGGGLNNKDKEFTKNSQNITIAANSAIILKRVK
jgi:1,4-alpha-glucan branching enzyme